MNADVTPFWFYIILRLTGPPAAGTRPSRSAALIRTLKRTHGAAAAALVGTHGAAAAALKRTHGAAVRVIGGDRG